MTLLIETISSITAFFTLEDLFPLKTNLVWVIVQILLLLLVFLVFSFLKINNQFTRKQLETGSEQESTTKEYQRCFFFLGILFIFLEIILEVYSIRPTSQLLINCSTGIVMIVMYFLNKKFHFIYNNLQTIFISFFHLYFRRLEISLVPYGYEATKKIRELQTVRIPIIALTAGAVVGVKEKWLEVGMDDYASKPIIKDTLELVITKWISII